MFHPCRQRRGTSAAAVRPGDFSGARPVSTRRGARWLRGSKAGAGVASRPAGVSGHGVGGLATRGTGGRTIRDDKASSSRIDSSAARQTRPLQPPAGSAAPGGRTVRVGLLVPIGPVSSWTTLWSGRGPRPRTPWVVMPTHAAGAARVVAAPTRSCSNSPGLVTHPWVAGRRPRGGRPARGAQCGRPGSPRRRPGRPRHHHGSPKSQRSHQPRQVEPVGETRTTRRPPRRVVRVSQAGVDSRTTGSTPGRKTAPTPAGRPRLAGLSVATPWHPQTTVAGPGHDPRMQQERRAGRGNLHPRTGRRRLRPGGTVRFRRRRRPWRRPGCRPWWGPPLIASTASVRSGIVAGGRRSRWIPAIMQRTDPPASSMVGMSTATISQDFLDDGDLVRTQAAPGAARHRHQVAAPALGGATAELDGVPGELPHLLLGRGSTVRPLTESRSRTLAALFVGDHVEGEHRRRRCRRTP